MNDCSQEQNGSVNQVQRGGPGVVEVRPSSRTEVKAAVSDTFLLQ